jgi:hypothetical protein
VDKFLYGSGLIQRGNVGSTLQTAAGGIGGGDGSVGLIQFGDVGSQRAGVVVEGVVEGGGDGSAGLIQFGDVGSQRAGVVVEGGGDGSVGRI